jgi:hypothetical protein
MKRGLKMNLYQLTDSTKIVGYVLLELWTKDIRHNWVCMEVEVYVVPGMQVPLLLGEDFMINYELNVYHRAKGSTIEIGSTGCALPARMATKAHNPGVFQVEPRTKPVAHWIKAKLHRKRHTKMKKEPSTVVRNCHEFTIKPHSILRVLVSGDFREAEDWFVEQTFIERGMDQYLSVPPTMLSSSEPYLPVTNLTNFPQTVKKDTILGQLSNPKEVFHRPQTEEEYLNLANRALAIERVIQGMLRDRDTAKPRMEVDPTSLQEEEPEASWGPKTLESPEAEIFPSANLRELLDWGLESSPEIRERFFAIAKKQVKAFGFDSRLGHYPLKVHVQTADGTVLHSLPTYGASPAKQEVIDKQIQMWFEQDVIEKSISPWAAPVVIVYQNGKARFCMDYRKLNSVTIPDEHPIPRQSEILQALSRAQVLSSMDALSGFTQLEMAQED